MLVPLSKWPLKPTSTVRIFAYVHPYTPAKSPTDLGSYWTKVHEIFIRRNLNKLLYSPLFALHLLKVWWSSVYRLWWKQRKRGYFCICASTHFLQTYYNISMIHCTKVHEILQYIEDTTIVKCQHKNEGVSCQLVAVLCHKIGCHGNVPWPKYTKFLAIRFFSSTVLTQ